jgi:hypothetical protein
MPLDAKRSKQFKPAGSGDKHLKRVRKICLDLPDVTEKISHGEPTFFVSNRVFAMFANNHHNDGHIAVWVAAAAGLQEALTDEAPKTYFRPPYVGPSGWIGIELAQVKDAVLTAHLKEAHEIIRAKAVKTKRVKKVSV